MQQERNGNMLIKKGIPVLYVNITFYIWNFPFFHLLPPHFLILPRTLPLLMLRIAFRLISEKRQLLFTGRVQSSEGTEGQQLKCEWFLCFSPKMFFLSGSRNGRCWLPEYNCIFEKVQWVWNKFRNYHKWGNLILLPYFNYKHCPKHFLSICLLRNTYVRTSSIFAAIKKGVLYFGSRPKRGPQFPFCVSSDLGYRISHFCILPPGSEIVLLTSLLIKLNNN